MKKINLALLILGITLSIKPAQMTFNEINQMMVSYHNAIFGVDHLFDQPISHKRLSEWLQVETQVSLYVNDHGKDIFGTKDPILMEALQTIQKANKALIDAIEITYHVKHNTRNLIRMAAMFKSIENKMQKVQDELKNSPFILKRKKNARSLLINFALFIEVTAKKANKDTRMGHRTDIIMPTTPQNIPKRQDIPLLPPSDLPPAYEEEAPFSPSTRVPEMPK